MKLLTDAQLAEMLDDPDGNYTHPGVEAAERIASMVAEIRMHRAGVDTRAERITSMVLQEIRRLGVEPRGGAPDPEAVIQRAHDLVKEREVARLEGLRTKDGE